MKRKSGMTEARQMKSSDRPSHQKNNSLAFTPSPCIFPQPPLPDLTLPGQTNKDCSAKTGIMYAL